MIRWRHYRRSLIGRVQAPPLWAESCGRRDHRLPGVDQWDDVRSGTQAPPTGSGWVGWADATVPPPAGHRCPEGSVGAETRKTETNGQCSRGIGTSRTRNVQPLKKNKFELILIESAPRSRVSVCPFCPSVTWIRRFGVQVSVQVSRDQFFSKDEIQIFYFNCNWIFRFGPCVCVCRRRLAAGKSCGFLFTLAPVGWTICIFMSCSLK